VFAQFVHKIDELAQGTAEAIELPHEQFIALSAIVHSGPEPRPILPAGGDLLLKDLLAPKGQKIPALEFGVLVLLGGADVTDLHHPIDSRPM